MKSFRLHELMINYYGKALKLHAIIPIAHRDKGRLKVMITFDNKKLEWDAILDRYRRDAPSVMCVAVYNHLEPTTKGEIFRTRPHNAIPSKKYPKVLCSKPVGIIRHYLFKEKDDHLIPAFQIDRYARNDRETEKFFPKDF